MSVAIAIAVLAFVDCLLSGFRVAAGRNGRLEKRAYYIGAVARAAIWGLVLVGSHALLTVALCAASADRVAAWDVFVDAARPLVVIYGVFATLILGAFGFYFAPIGDFRVLTNVIVFGPLTLARRVVVLGGLLFAIAWSRDVRVAIVAISAGIAMSSFETLIGRRYAGQWRRLLQR